MVKRNTEKDNTPEGILPYLCPRRIFTLITNQTNSTMKKFIYATLALAAVLLFASCKNDKNQPNDQEKADAFISFTFNLPQGGTRAGVADKNAGDLYVGTEAEQAIKDVRVVLYDPDSKEAKYSFDYNITSNGTAKPTGDGLATNPAQEPTAARFTTKAQGVVNQEYQMLAIVNPTSAVKDATAQGKYLADALAAIETTVDNLKANGILMSNEQGLVTVATTQMKATDAEAEQTPVAVNVDRILAKVFVGGNPTFENGKLTDIKWQLNVTNKKTYIFRQFGKVVKGTEFPDEVAKDGSTRFDRYAKDPNFLASEFNNADFIYLEGTPELTGNFGFNDADGQYCLENTMDAPMQKHNGTTSFILSGTWTPAEHDGITFTAGETWYSYQGFTFTKAKMVEYKGIVENAAQNDKLEIDKTPAGFKAALKAALASMNVDAQGDVAASGTFEGIKAYKDGACYYQTNLIRHFNDSQSGKDMGYGRYGVVRNNIYKINISKISQPGEPDVVNEKDDDENDDPTKVFVAFDITVNPWIVRTQDISL